MEFLTQIFTSVLNISIRASVLVLIVFLLRKALKNTVPNKSICLLWDIVLLRLVFPFKIGSIFGLLPAKDFVGAVSGRNAGMTGLNTGPQITGLNNFAGIYPGEAAGGDLSETIFKGAALVWLIGIIAAWIYAAASVVRLKKRTAGRNAVSVAKGVLLVDMPDPPFVLGIFKPVVMIPQWASERARTVIIAHENNHLKRHDNVRKLLGFAILALHWFNPFVWIAYALMCRDVEYACDDLAAENMSKEERAEYSQLILDFNNVRPGKGFDLLPFAEIDAESRIRNILRTVKPKPCAAALTVVLAAALVLCTFTVSTGGKRSPAGDELPEEIADAEELSACLQEIGFSPAGTVYVGDNKTVYLFYDAASGMSRVVLCKNDTGFIVMNDSGPISSENDQPYEFAFDYGTDSLLVFVGEDETEIPPYYTRSKGDMFCGEGFCIAHLNHGKIYAQRYGKAFALFSEYMDALKNAAYGKEFSFSSYGEVNYSCGRQPSALLDALLSGSVRWPESPEQMEEYYSEAAGFQTDYIKSQFEENAFDSVTYTSKIKQNYETGEYRFDLLFGGKSNGNESFDYYVTVRYERSRSENSLPEYSLYGITWSEDEDFEEQVQTGD